MSNGMGREKRNTTQDQSQGLKGSDLLYPAVVSAAYLLCAPGFPMPHFIRPLQPPYEKDVISSLCTAANRHLEGLEPGTSAGECHSSPAQVAHGEERTQPGPGPRVDSPLTASCYWTAGNLGPRTGCQQRSLVMGRIS